jgi:hypothetical protein
MEFVRSLFLWYRSRVRSTKPFFLPPGRCDTAHPLEMPLNCKDDLPCCSHLLREALRDIVGLYIRSYTSHPLEIFGNHSIDYVTYGSTVVGTMKNNRILHWVKEVELAISLKGA